MKMACIGVARYKGSFNNQPFDNYEFYFADIENKNRIAGVVPLTKSEKVGERRSVKALSVWKVKVADWSDEKLKPTDYSSKTCDILYDAYGNIASVKLVG